jgi:hypothetical protein
MAVPPPPRAVAGWHLQEMDNLTLLTTFLHELRQVSKVAHSPHQALVIPAGSQPTYVWQPAISLGISNTTAESLKFKNSLKESKSGHEVSLGML